MDMMNYSNAAPAGVEPSDVIEQAASLLGAGRNSGVVVALVCPEKYRHGQEWWVSLHESDVDMDLEAIFDGKDPEGLSALTDDLDHMAEQLKKLRMPVQRCCGDPCMKAQTDGSGGAAAEQNAIKSSGS